MPPTSASALADWLVRLESFSAHEIELGLERVQRVLQRLQLVLPGTVLHIAGTNGKGSSVALAESLLARTGAVVGAYTSPHVLRYNERIAVAGKAADDEVIVAAFDRIESVRDETPLTYFEYGTLAALVVFEAQAVDIALLEIGMGGRLDAVNAVPPTAGLITNVALDHCDWLGMDVESIAFEKAGIMRAGIPIVFASETVPATIQRVAEETGAELVLAGRDYHWHSEGDAWHWRGRSQVLDDLAQPALLGEIQLTNAAGVLALIEASGFTELLKTPTVNAAFGNVSLVGRMQSLVTDRRWLLDVAHNAAAAAVLSQSLEATAVDGETIAIVGMLDDKDVEGIVTALADRVDRWIAVTADSERACRVDVLARCVANASNKACLEAASIADALDQARRMSDQDDRILNRLFLSRRPRPRGAWAILAPLRAHHDGTGFERTHCRRDRTGCRSCACRTGIPRRPGRRRQDDQ